MESKRERLRDIYRTNRDRWVELCALRHRDLGHDAVRLGRINALIRRAKDSAERAADAWVDTICND